MSVNEKPKLVISMPCFNEEEGIFQFIAELQNGFDGLNVEFIIVDDFSTDGTSKQLSRICDVYSNVMILTNSENVGHGPSTIRGLNYALSCNADWVLAVDGDGQFDSVDLRKCFDGFVSLNQAILEGSRIGRNDPKYRKIITFALRIVVFAKTRNMPADANTPFRIYRHEALVKLLPLINASCLIPNIELSILSRKLKMSILETKIPSRDRLGANKIGTTWKSTTEWLPSSRFILFCLNASKQLFASLLKF
jgi:glycosyltransferase involved in cell wall biosynthesis